MEDSFCAIVYRSDLTVLMVLFIIIISQNILTFIRDTICNLHNKTVNYLCVFMPYKQDHNNLHIHVLNQTIMIAYFWQLFSCPQRWRVWIADQCRVSIYKLDDLIDPLKPSSQCLMCQCLFLAGRVLSLNKSIVQNIVLGPVIAMQHIQQTNSLSVLFWSVTQIHPNKCVCESMIHVWHQSNRPRCRRIVI